MAFRDIFQKKKLQEKALEGKKEEKVMQKEMEKGMERKKPETESKSTIEAAIKKELKGSNAWRILRAPHITEKATLLLDRNQYVFKVEPRTNKLEIKKAIEDLYGVNVLAVKIIKVPPRKRRLGRIEGWRKGYKKAIVKIKEGQKIEILPR